MLVGVALDPEALAWAEKIEPLWRRAHRIVSREPTLDVSDVFHALRKIWSARRRNVFTGR